MVQYRMENGLNVLIVEDEPMLAELLKKMVLQLGAARAWTCADDACAFETAMREPVDLVFMDLNIEGATDGIQCARRITQHKEVSIVFATSFCDGEVLEEAIDLNTLNFLVKPYGKKDVEITLNLARIARKKRRQHDRPSASASLHQLEGGVTMDIAARTLRHGPETIRLGKKGVRPARAAPQASERNRSHGNHPRRRLAASARRRVDPARNLHPSAQKSPRPAYQRRARHRLPAGYCRSEPGITLGA